MSSSYERLPQEGDDDSWELASHSAQPQRPTIYYGHGPFDPPSSDDEDEDVLREKGGSRSPGLAESGLDGEDGQKKRPSSLRWLIISLVTLVGLAGVWPYFYDNVRVLDTRISRLHWHICCSIIQICWSLSPSRCSAHNHGSYLQWNFPRR